MTAREWLIKHGKHPEEDDGVFIWSDGAHFNGPGCIPPDVFNQLGQSVAWSKIYPSERIAYREFYAAFAVAVRKGWEPK